MAENSRNSPNKTDDQPLVRPQFLRQWLTLKGVELCRAEALNAVELVNTLQRISTVLRRRTSTASTDVRGWCLR